MTIIDVLYALGIIQGITLLLVLLSIKGSRQQANRIMAVMVAVLVLQLGHYLLLRQGFFLDHPATALSHVTLDYLVGPLLYFYGLSLVQHRFQRIQLLHFLPALLALIPMITFNNLQPDYQVVFLKYLWFRELSLSQVNLSQLPLPTLWNLWIKYALHGTLFLVHVGIYCLLLHKTIKVHRHHLISHYSSIEERDLKWLQNLNLGLIIYLLIFLVFNRIPRLVTTPESPANFNPQLVLVLLVQAIALVSLWQPDLIHGRQPSKDRPTDNKPVPKRDNDDDTSSTTPDPDMPVSTFLEENEDDEKETYKRSGLSLEVAQEYRIKVMQVMQEKQLYLDNELTLNDLAEQADILPHHLSEVLNRQMNQNFYSFVNDYRVHYAKELLSNPDTRDMPVVELAFEAGFRSKSSFYEAFKKATSTTPTQYKKMCRA